MNLCDFICEWCSEIEPVFCEWCSEIELVLGGIELVLVGVGSWS
jgi:hypothetical protein